MRLKFILGAIGLCLCVSGCQLTAEITHNMVFETCLFADEVKGKFCYPMQARSAWKEYLAQHPDMADSKDFAKGFRLGYADYLENGGDCNSRSLPPLRYWKIRNETPEGRLATKLWLAGFREGAMAARASGTRELIVVPVGDISGAAPLPPEPPLPGTPLPGAPLPGVPLPSSPVPGAPLSGPPLLPAPPTQLPPVQPPQPPQPSSDYLPEPRTLPPTPYSKTSWRIDPETVEPSRQKLVVRANEKASPSGQAEQGVRQAIALEADAADGKAQIRFKYVPQDIQRFAAVSTGQMRKTPHDPEPLYQVGIIAMRAGAVEEGLRWLHKALAEDNNHRASHRALMEYYQSIGDFHRAAEHRVMAEMQLTDMTKTDDDATK